MKKQPDLILFAPDEYNQNYSVYYQKKHLRNRKINRKLADNLVNPLLTDYDTINLETSSVKKIYFKKSFPQKIVPLPTISKHGLFYNTNRLLTLNQKSLEGFKPIEDNKIRNKIKQKNNNKHLSIHYLSLDDNNNQLVNYISYLLNDNKNKNYFLNNRYGNPNLKKKLLILNRYLNKAYEKDKKQFTKYFKEKNDYIKEILTKEIMNKTSKLKLRNINRNDNGNVLYTHFSPKPKEITFSTCLNNDFNYSYNTLNNIENNNLNYYNKYSSSYGENVIFPNIKTEKKEIEKEKEEEKEEKEKEEEKDEELIIHNVFFEWVMDNVILRIDEKDNLNNYYNLLYQNRDLSAKRNLKGMLNNEIKKLSNYLFKNNNNLDNSFDLLIKSLRPISNDIIKIKNKPRKIKVKNKKTKSANLVRTIYDYEKKQNKINFLDNNIKDDGNIKQKILNKLILKIVNINKVDNLDMKYSGEKINNLNVLIPGKKLNKKK